MAVDCCSLLISVLSFEVVAGASRVDPAGSTPKTVVLGSTAGEELRGMSALMGGGVFSVQPRPDTANNAVVSVNARPDIEVEPKLRRIMLGSKSFMNVMIARRR